MFSLVIPVKVGHLPTHFQLWLSPPRLFESRYHQYLATQILLSIIWNITFRRLPDPLWEGCPFPLSSRGLCTPFCCVYMEQCLSPSGGIIQWLSAGSGTAPLGVGVRKSVGHFWSSRWLVRTLLTFSGRDQEGEMSCESRDSPAQQKKSFYRKFYLHQLRRTAHFKWCWETWKCFEESCRLFASGEIKRKQENVVLMASQPHPALWY